MKHPLRPDRVFRRYSDITPAILQEMGIPITETELRTLIESAVKTMNDNFSASNELQPAPKH